MASSTSPTRESARRGAIARLRDAGIETAVLDADLLLAHVLGVRKEDVYAHPEAPITDWALGTYRELVARRSRGEPVAYLRGVKEFYGMELVVSPAVLIPRPETEILVQEAVRRLATREAPAVCDLGTGSGAVAIAIAAELPRARIVAVDASEAALSVARENLSRQSVGDRVGLRQGDLLAPLGGPVDAVVANLPYLTTAEVEAAAGTSIAFEPREALDGGADGLDVIRLAVAALPRYLSPGGVALFECAPAQAEEVALLLRTSLRARTEIVRDLAGRERVVVGTVA